MSELKNFQYKILAWKNFYSENKTSERQQFLFNNKIRIN